MKLIKPLIIGVFCIMIGFAVGSALGYITTGAL